MADLSVTAASVVAAAASTPMYALAGETITAGQALYIRAADGCAMKAQSDGTAAEATCVGVALNGGGAGQTIGYAPNGTTINIGATTAKTVVYVVSAAAGGVCPMADLVSTNRVCFVGYATATDGSFVVWTKLTGAAI